MNSKTTYIFFSPQNWNSQQSRTRALAIELSKLGYQTIYVDPPNSLAAVVRESVARAVYPLRRENVRFEHNYELLKVWSPPILPTFYRGSITPGFDRWLFKQWFEKRIGGLGGPIVAVIAMPYWWDGYINDYQELFSATVFDYQDTVRTYARNTSVLQRMEKVFDDLVSRADGVVTHTSAHYAAIGAFRKSSEVSLIRNGGDGMYAGPEGTPVDKKKSYRPVIGTIGRISSNIDISLLAELADHFPDATIENIGTVGSHAEVLKNKKNVSFVPPMSPEELRLRLRNFNVGLLPYHQTIEGSPLRIYDMLSVSLQIISTDFPDAEYFRDVVHIVRSHNEFISKVEDILLGKSKLIKGSTIQEFLCENTWGIRAHTLVSFCEGLRHRS